MSDLISIIIPAYNIEKYIGKCIKSVTEQDYSNIEIIVVNDGSTDRTEEICSEYYTVDSRIKYIKQENQGLVGARKTGLTKASGKYVIFVDGDDYIDKNLVSQLYMYIIKNDIDFVHSNYKINGRNMNYVKTVHKYNENVLDVNFRKQILKNHVFEWNMEKEIFECNLYGCIYKTEFIKQCYESVPDYQQYGEDLLCFCNQIMKCKSMMILPNAYYNYVIREGSLDHPNSFEKALTNKISLYKEVKKLLKEYSILEELSEQCQIYFAKNMLHDFKMITSNRINIGNNFYCDFVELLDGKKIVLYGAGCVGQDVFYQLNKKIEIVEWVDSNYNNITNLMRRISDPKSIKTLVYDYVVIAVEREDIARQIINNLIGMGVNREKILWKPFLKSFSVTIN